MVRRVSDKGYIEYWANMNGSKNRNETFKDERNTVLGMFCREEIVYIKEHPERCSCGHLEIFHNHKRLLFRNSRSSNYCEIPDCTCELGTL